MSATQAIANYELLLSLTAQMREAAISGEWEQLIVLEQQCRVHVDAMKPVDESTTLDEPTRQRKVRLIKKILDHDADIRNRTVAWMGQMQRIMQSSRQEQRLHQAYGSVRRPMIIKPAIPAPKPSDASRRESERIVAQVSH